MRAAKRVIPVTLTLSLVLMALVLVSAPQRAMAHIFDDLGMTWHNPCEPGSTYVDNWKDRSGHSITLVASGSGYTAVVGMESVGPRNGPYRTHSTVASSPLPAGQYIQDGYELYLRTATGQYHVAHWARYGEWLADESTIRIHRVSHGADACISVDFLIR